MKKNYFIPLILLTLLIYFPAFITEFGMHNDYRFIPGNFKDHQIFSEAEHLYVVGRPLQAVLVTVQGWMINQIWEFAIVRFISFLFMLAFGILFYFFLHRRLKIDPFWSTIIVFNILLLPSSQIYVLWAAHFIPGYVTLLFSLGSYLALTSSQKNKDNPTIPKLLISAFLFLTALFLYPMNGVFVFVCTLATIFLSAIDNAQKTRIVLRDIAFYGICMGIYFLSIKFFFIPYTPPLTMEHDLEKTPYDFNISLNLLGKTKLLGQTLWTALGGIGHLFWRDTASGIGLGTIILGILILFFFSKTLDSDRKTSHKTIVSSFLLLIIFSIILFLLANAPLVGAKKCFTLLGYRVLFPSAVIVVIGQWAIWRKASEILKNLRAVSFLKIFAIGLVLFNSMLAFLNVKDACRNYNKELNFMREKLSAVDFKSIRKILVAVIPDEETLIERRIPFEFSYMMTLPALIDSVVEEIAQKQNAVHPLVGVDDGHIGFYDRYTAVVDLNDARIFPPSAKGQTPRKALALVTTSDSSLYDLEISREMATFFTFKEKWGDKLLPFWLVDPNHSPIPWIEIEFQNEARALKIFTCVAYEAIQSKGVIDLEYRLKGSSDGQRWEDLNVMVGMVDQNFKLFQVADPRPFKKYRFYLLPKNEHRPITISAVHMAVGIY